MKKVTRLADAVLERLVLSSKASAEMQARWTECRFNVFCAVIGRRETMSCRVVDTIKICDSTGCGC